MKGITQRLKKVRADLEKAKAKAHGMTVPELRRHLAKRKAEKRAFKAELRRKERKERQKFEQWKIEQKYKGKRKAVKSGKSGLKGVSDLIIKLGGSGPSGDDPLGILGSRKKKRKKKKETWYI